MKSPENYKDRLSFGLPAKRQDGSCFRDRIRCSLYGPNVVDLAFSIPVDWKIHGPEKTEKWILRKAFENDLPESVVWRKKSKFSVGSGSSHLMKEYAEEAISDSEFERERQSNGIRSKEELLYYRIFEEQFPAKELRTPFTEVDPARVFNYFTFRL